MSDRRRIAVIDGERVHEIVVPVGVPIGTALDTVGLRIRPGAQTLVERSGREVPEDQEAGRLDDGALLTVVDVGGRVERGRARADTGDALSAGDTVSWWVLAGVGLLVAALILAGWAPAVPVRAAIVGGSAVAAVAGAVVWSWRSGSVRVTGSAAILGPLCLAFAAGAAAVPAAVAGPTLLVVSGLACAAVLAALVALVAASSTVRDGVGSAAVVLAVLAALWTVVLLLGLPAQAAGAVTLGAAPAALRTLPSLLLDVSPGMFIDYERHQQNRWTVRERLPEPAGRVTIDGARRLADQSTARMLSATVLVAGAAAVAAPLAIVPLRPAEPIVYWGQVVLAVTAGAALILGARRSSAPVLRWVPRVAAAAVALSGAAAVVLALRPLDLTVVAAALLLLGVACAAVLVAVGRGASSLFWSRLADIAETLCLVLALPAGLVAAGAIDLMRGVMA